MSAGDLPEAATGGPIAVIRDGDRVRIDVARRRIDLCLPAEDIEARARDTAVTVEPRSGWLGQYQRLVNSLDRGGVLTDLEHGRGTREKT